MLFTSYAGVGKLLKSFLPRNFVRGKKTKVVFVYLFVGFFFFAWNPVFIHLNFAFECKFILYLGSFFFIFKIWDEADS